MSDESNAASPSRTRSGAQLFSKEALQKMRSPEKLDEVLPITTPVTWMALVALVVTMFSILLWSIFGAFTIKVDGMGLITDPGGVTNITTVYGGRIDKLYIQSGDHVKKGDLIAHIDQASEAATTQMSQYGPELAQNDRDAINRVHEFDVRRHQEEMTQNIYSDYDGIVDEIFVFEGSTVGSGSPICTVRMTGGRRDLKGILYVPVDKGKRIKPGQTIQLAPNGVDTSQTGSLIGVVRSVSQYPVSMQSIQNRLGNDHLAQWILQTQQSSVMEVVFDLVRDKSGNDYLWTSTVGDHPPITAGSFCTGSIIIDRQPPIEKVFYKLSQWLRNR